MSRREFLSRWAPPVVVGESAGFAVAATVAVAASATLSDGWSLPAIIAGGVAEGALLGLAQSVAWSRIGERVNRGRWVALTAAGAGIAWVLGMTPSTLGVSEWPLAVVVVVMPVLAVALLASIPALQWLELRRQLPHPTWWITVNAGAWIIGVAWTIVPSPFIDESTPVPFLVAAYVVAGVLMATTVAIVTGLGVYRHTSVSV
jgi:hypothetical protein